MVFPFGRATCYDAEHFMISSANQQAVAWLQRFPHWPAGGLIVQGDRGTGKTHMLNVFVQQRGAKKMTVSDITSLLEEQHALPPLAIDDVDQQLSAHHAEMLFHLLQRLHGEGGCIFLTSTRPPAGWEISLNDLRSRLMAMGLATLAMPDDDLCRQMMAKAFADRQVDVGQEVINHLLRHRGRNPATLLQWVERLDDAAMQTKRKISLSLLLALEKEDEKGGETLF
ncbi:MAG: hypothetical protein EBZ69_06845 [Alphaproteobacteria bacterium]|nr:hypothetical protein [Alphaproteobacteria bacterium]NDC56511.1 hypothetical protein [Alphaproteobacteria bacterium]